MCRSATLSTHINPSFLGIIFNNGLTDDRMESLVYEEVIALLDGTPATAPVSWIAAFFHVTPSTVIHAIHDERLPAEAITDGGGKVLGYRIRPLDATLLWGTRLYKKGA